MKTIVLKFGGTSVGSIERIKKIAKKIINYKKKIIRLSLYPQQWQVLQMI